MPNNIDEWLNQIDLNTATEARTNAIPVSQVTLPSDSVLSTTMDEPEPQPLSDDDFNNILSENGFEEVPEAEAEEVHDGSDDEGIEDESYDENGGEGRDLDAEEDADFEELVTSGSVIPVDMECFQALQQNSIGAWNRLVQSHTQAETPEIVRVSIGDESADVPVVHENSQEPPLPPNSPTLLMDDSTSRFSGTEWYEAIQHQRILVAGCGGIGSNLAFQLARLHPEVIHLYDDDIVERANMSGQLFSHSDVGMNKADAVAGMIRRYSTTTGIYALDCRFSENSNRTDIMMCGFDNMAARRTFFDSWIAHIVGKTDEKKKKCLYLDGRLSIDTLQIFCIRGDDAYNQERYDRDFLFSDEDADATVCSMKQTTYMACMIGSLMTNLFVNFVADTLDPVIPYDLPFFTEYDSQNMIFKTEN